MVSRRNALVMKTARFSNRAVNGGQWKQCKFELIKCKKWVFIFIWHFRGTVVTRTSGSSQFSPVNATWMFGELAAMNRLSKENQSRRDVTNILLIRASVLFLRSHEFLIVSHFLESLYFLLWRTLTNKARARLSACWLFRYSQRSSYRVYCMRRTWTSLCRWRL